MNQLATQHKDTGLMIPDETTELIRSSIVDSTLKRYQRLSEADRSMARWSDVVRRATGNLHHQGSR